jgi:hypothetical protein
MFVQTDIVSAIPTFGTIKRQSEWGCSTKLNNITNSNISITSGRATSWQIHRVQTYASTEMRRDGTKVHISTMILVSITSYGYIRVHLSASVTDVHNNILTVQLTEEQYFHTFHYIYVSLM